MPLDIVIFGVIAVILIFRFLGVLGQNDKNDGRPRRDTFGNYRSAVEEKKARREEERARRAEERGTKKTHLTERERAGYKATSTATPAPPPAATQKVTPAAGNPTSDVASLSDKAFLEGAKGAFVMILEAYAAGDLPKLKALLEKDMFARMKEEIDKRQNAEERLEISLHEIVDAHIEERSQEEHHEQIAVSFASKQCHLLFDKDNKLIEGDPDEEDLLRDLWTFRQNLASQDPTWFLCATRSQGEGAPRGKGALQRKSSAARKKTSVKKTSSKVLPKTSSKVSPKVSSKVLPK